MPSRNVAAVTERSITCVSPAHPSSCASAAASSPLPSTTVMPKTLLRPQGTRCPQPAHRLGTRRAALQYKESMSIAGVTRELLVRYLDLWVPGAVHSPHGATFLHASSTG